MGAEHEIRFRPDLTWIRLAGRIEAADACLMDLVPMAMNAGRPAVVDLTEVISMDPIGCGFLAALVIALRPAQVTVTGATPSVSDQLRQLRLDTAARLINPTANAAPTRHP